MIKVENLVFKYKKVKENVIDNLSMEIKEPISVILGLNGCGKTTLIKLLTGLEEKNSGNIIINNKNLDDISIFERSKEISYVSQTNINNSNVNVLDYLTFGMTNKLKFYEKIDDKIKEKAINISKRFDIENLLDKALGEISGGERQLVSICCSLLQDSKIIILDEPTSALDVKNQAKVLKILKDIVLKDNKEIILTTHNPNHALALNAYVYLMKNGKILKESYASEIINENLIQVYGENLVLSKDLPYQEVSFKIDK